MSAPETSRATRDSPRLRRIPTAAALVAVAATVGLWLVLSASTRLIFHFLPGASFVTGAYIFRLVAGGPRAGPLETAALLLASVVGTSAGILAVPALGGELDAPPVTLLVVAAGAAIGIIWLRRGAGSGDR